MNQFHAFRLDTTNHCLWRGSERVSLAPKAFDLLRYLVEHRDRLVTQEILEALWADTFVNQEVVKKYILGIRKVLGDRRDHPEFIRTFPKRGYQFVAPVTDDRTSTGRRAAASGSLVDRRNARARIEKSLERAMRGERQVVFVTGDAGIGKTTFVDLFVRGAGGLQPGLRIARGQSVEGFGGQEAYYPMLEAIDQLIRASDDGSLVEALAKRAPTWLLQFPALVKPGQREALERDTAGATRERMVREACELVEAITADHTLILVLEDLHWADPSTLDIIFDVRPSPGTGAAAHRGTLRRPTAAAQPQMSRLRQDLPSTTCPTGSHWRRSNRPKCPSTSRWNSATPALGSISPPPSTGTPAGIRSS